MPGAMVGLAALYTTFASREDAERIASRLLDERLVACANAFSVTSLYDWKGERKRDVEVAVLFKTTRARAKHAARRLRELHPYDVPCIEQWPVARVLPAYASWVAANTAIKATPARRRRRSPRA